MALQVNQPTVTQNNESAARAYNSNVRLSKRALEDMKRVPPVQVASAETAVTGYIPNPYTLLLSRIENNAAAGTPERDSIDQLARMLTAKLPGIPDKAKRQIAALPEFSAAGLSDLSALPMGLRGRLMENRSAQTLLALLKHPLFASYIKDSQRASLYGPTGMLLAS
jgi:hypothetical protein